jgi:hypothetical protein
MIKHHNPSPHSLRTDFRSTNPNHPLGRRDFSRGNHPLPSSPPPRRYPSLAGDGRPWLPPEKTVRRSAMAALFPGDGRGILSVRAISLVAILGILAALAAGS